MKSIGCLTIILTAAVAISCGGSSGNVALKGSSSTSGLALTDATLFKLKVYKVAVSTSNLCTNLQTVYTNNNPSYATFDGTAFGSMTVPDGTYPCVVFEVSDVIKFTPASTSGAACIEGTEYSREVCRDGGGSGLLINGDTFTCSNGEQRMGIYLSTASTSTGGGDDANPFTPPTADPDADRGMKLNGAFTVSGTATATFIVDGNDIVDTNGDECDMQPPQWGFE